MGGKAEPLRCSRLPPIGHSGGEVSLPTEGRFMSPGYVGSALGRHPRQPTHAPTACRQATLGVNQQDIPANPCRRQHCERLQRRLRVLCGTPVKPKALPQL